MTEVFIRPFNTANFLKIDVRQDIPLPMSYSIVDLLSDKGGPAERQASGSKTLAFPGTKNNNTVFGLIFEINLTDCSYNVSKKADIRIYQDGILVAEGVVRLNNIVLIGDVIDAYETVSSCGHSNIIAKMTENGTDLLLDDIEFDHDFHHILTSANVIASWTAPIGTGYVYPMIDFGMNNVMDWKIEQIYPAIYAREYLKRIFSICGFTWTSAFLDSTLFKSLAIPSSPGQYILPTAEINTRQFQATLTSGTITFSGSLNPVPFNHVTSPDFDPSGQWDTGAHHWVVPVGKGGHYRIEVGIHVSASPSSNLTGTIVKLRSNLHPSAPLASQLYGGVSPIGVNWVGDLVDGEIIYVVVESTASINVLNSSYIKNTAYQSYAENQPVDMNVAVPGKIKMADFFNSIVNMFNLYMDVDTNNPTNLIIEPRSQFYEDGQVIDWTKKWDRSKPVTITPMGYHNSKNYLYTYSKDGDYWNSFYSAKYWTIDHNDIYGEREIVTDNDFLTDTKKIEIIFAPTPLNLYKDGTFGSNTKVLPTVHFPNSTGNDPTINTDNISNPVIRILYYGGLKSGNWNLIDGSGTTAKTDFPYAGHLDDPYSPQFDLLFGTPAEVFYAFTGQGYTTANLYNLYHQPFIDEITDNNSKVVEMTMKLTALDIMNLDFRDTIFIDKTYYKLLEINDYDMSCYKLTKCKFLKSSSVAAIATSGYTNGGGDNPPFVNYGNHSAGRISALSVQDLGGQNNKINEKASDILVKSDGNTIYGASKNVLIQGGGTNTVMGTNVTLINCTGLTIEENDVVYINNIKYEPANTSGHTTLAAGASPPIVFMGVTATSVIIITWDGTGLCLGRLSVTAGTDSFTINSSSAGDTAGVNWFVAKL